MERKKLIGAAAVAAVTIGIALESQGQKTACNDVSWRQERNGYTWTSPSRLLYDGHLAIEKDTDALFGITITWEQGEKIGEMEVPKGDIAFCIRDTDSVVTHRDGREWTVPGKAYSMTFGSNYTAIGYWVDMKKDYENTDQRRVMVFTEDGRVVDLGALSPYSITEVTDEWIIYSIISGPNTYMQKQYFIEDGHEITITQGGW